MKRLKLKKQELQGDDVSSTYQTKHQIRSSTSSPKLKTAISNEIYMSSANNTGMTRPELVFKPSNTSTRTFYARTRPQLVFKPSNTSTKTYNATERPQLIFKLSNQSKFQSTLTLE